MRRGRPLVSIRSSALSMGILVKTDILSLINLLFAGNFEPGKLLTVFVSADQRSRSGDKVFNKRTGIFRLFQND